MNDFKTEISKEVLDTLTMEDLWEGPRFYINGKEPKLKNIFPFYLIAQFAVVGL